MKKVFLILVFLIFSSFLVAKDDLTRQTPITQIVNFHGIEGEGHYFEPSYLEFETGKLYKLVLKNKSDSKHYFTSKKFAESIFTRKIQVSIKGEKIAEIKGNIYEVEVFPENEVEWWFVPIKTGEFNDLECRIKDKTRSLSHADMGMKGVIKIY